MNRERRRAHTENNNNNNNTTGARNWYPVNAYPKVCAYTRTSVACCAVHTSFARDTYLCVRDDVIIYRVRSRRRRRRGRTNRYRQIGFRVIYVLVVGCARIVLYVLYYA